MGLIIATEGLKPDTEKVGAKKGMPPPETREDVCRFLGFIHYLYKFLPMLAEVKMPRRTRKVISFYSDKSQLNLSQEMTMQCDASKNAAGAGILQEGRPILYASWKLRFRTQLSTN